MGIGSTKHNILSHLYGEGTRPRGRRGWRGDNTTGPLLLPHPPGGDGVRLRASLFASN